MATEADTFKALKEPKYRLQVSLNYLDEDELNLILDGLRTTISEEPDVLPNGDAYYPYLTIEQLTEEIFCLGICYREIELEHEIEHPFDYYISQVS